MITCNDSAGNTGSAMVYFTQDNTPPTITVLYPSDDTYNNSRTFNVAFTPTDDFDFINCTLRDNRSSVMANTVLNTSTVQNDTENIITETFTSDGHYNISIKCENTRSQIVETSGFLIKVDTLKPTITINSPENITYTTTGITLNISTDESTLDNKYSLNGASNISIEKVYNETANSYSCSANYVYMNYTKHASSTTADWQIKFGGTPIFTNVTMIDSCYDYDLSILQLRLYTYSKVVGGGSEHGTSYGQCYNDSWNTITDVEYSTGGGTSSGLGYCTQVYDGNWDTYAGYDVYTPGWRDSTTGFQKYADLYEEAIWWENDIITVQEGYNNITVYATDLAGNSNESNIIYFIADSLSPSVSDLNWQTTSGSNSDALNYNQVLDWIKVTVTDATLQNVTIVVKKPDNSILVDNVTMTIDAGDVYVYNNDITLSSNGTWTITVYANDTVGHITSNTETIEVTIQAVATAEGYFGYDTLEIPTELEIADYVGTYSFSLIGIHDNFSNINSNWTAIKNAINDTKEQNARIFLKHYFDGDYSDNTYIQNTIDSINAKYINLKDSPYYDGTLFIVISLNETNSEPLQTDFTNNISEHIVNATNNKFAVYVQTLDNASLDSAYVRTWDMNYNTYTSNTTFINDETLFLRNNVSTTRIYHTLSDAFKNTVQQYNEDILRLMRGTPLGTAALSDNIAAEVNTYIHDVIVFNNQSSETSYTINVSDANRNNKVVWDYSLHKLLEKNTDGNFSVTVPAYFASMLLFEDLNHITYSESTSIVYTEDTSEETYANYTTVPAGALSSFCYVSTIHDVKFEIWDGSYLHNNTYFHDYGWLNATQITDWSGYDYIIISDKNKGELDYLELQYSDIRTNMFGYINVAGFADTDEWENDVKLEAWNWTDVYGINVFIDGLDAGVLGAGFETRLKRITDSIRVDKNKKVILNDYTSYEDVSNYGDIDMKESWCGRWDDSVYNPTYSYETLSVDKNRAIWARTNPHPQLAMTFGDVNDVEKMSYCYAMYLVLLGNANNNSYRYAQPNFQTQREIRVKQVGSQLESTWTETSSTDWNRKFTNGVMHIDPIAHTWSFDDGRTIESAELCFELYNDAGTPQSNPGIDVRINNHTDEYRITYDMIAGGSNYVWDWVCINVTAENHLNDLKYGRWNVYTFAHDRSEPNSLVVIRNEKSNGTGIHSWWDQSSNNTEITGIDELNPYASWNAYGRSVTNNDTEVINWHTSLNIDATSKVSVDTFTTDNLITRTESTSKGATTVSYDSLHDYNITVWDNGTYVDKLLTLSVLNGATYERIYPENTATCDSDNPTWNTTTVAGDDWGACYETIDGQIYVRVAIPHLSQQTYQIDSDETPTLTWLYPADDTYNTSRSFDVAFTPSDDYHFVNCTLRDNRSGVMANTALNTSVISNDTTNKIAETFTVDGHYNISVRCEDNATQIIETAGYLIKVDATLPTITISSPTNITYATTSINLNWNVDETVDWSAYSLNSNNNVTITGYCYQETANVSTSCGGLSTGNYTGTTLGSDDWDLAFDENWNTNAYNVQIFVNYSKPVDALSSSLWMIKDASNTVNVSVSQCWDNYSDKIVLKGITTGAGLDYYAKYYCYDSSSWIEVLSVSVGGLRNDIYEEAMWWNITDINTTFTAQEGSNNIVIYANDSAGNINQSNYVYFTVDTISPIITIDSPENTTYNTDEIWFNVTLNENTDTCLYSLDNSDNITMSNDTLTHFYHQNVSMSGGAHTVVFHCNDSVGNMNSTEITFKISEIQYVFDVYENNLAWLDTYNTVNISCINISSNITANYTFGNMSISDVNTSSIIVYDNASNIVSYDFVSPRYLNFNVTAANSPYTIQYTRKDLKKLTVAESSMSCPAGYADNGPYCRMTTSTTDRVYYYYRLFWNVTTNDTVSTEINANYTDTTFTNFGLRATAPGISMNGNSADTSHTNLDSKVQIKVGTAHDSGIYSLHQDEYYIDFNYYVFSAQLPPEGGTGGGDGPSQEEEDTRYKVSVCGDGICAWDENYLNCSKDCVYDRNDFEVNESISYNLISGVTHKQEITVRNLGSKTIKLLIEPQCEKGYEDMCTWQWFMFNDVQSKDTVIELVPFGESTFTLYTLPPLSTTEITYTIHLKLTRYDLNKDEDTTNIKFIRIDQTVMLSSIFETLFDYVLDLWAYEISSDWEKPVPLTEKDNITLGDIAIIGMLSIFVLFIVNKYSTAFIAIFKS